jgi:hypothetical protein
VQYFEIFAIFVENVAMKLRTLILILLLSLFSVAEGVAKRVENSSRKGKGGYDIYLLIGQSNMAGRGKLLQQDTLSTIKGVWLLNDKDKPEPARNPLNKYSSIRKSYKSQRMSPGYGFAAKVQAKTGRELLLVHNARGGTCISWWLPESDYSSPNYYKEAVRRTKRAMKYGTLKGILWHQGCGDSGRNNLPYYMERLQILVQSLRKDLKSPNVPFVAGELAYWRKSSKGFNEMIRTISEYIPNAYWVSAEGCEMLRDEKDPHFSREGQLLLGERYADKILSVVYDIE